MFSKKCFDEIKVDELDPWTSLLCFFTAHRISKQLAFYPLKPTSSVDNLSLNVRTKKRELSFALIGVYFSFGAIYILEIVLFSSHYEDPEMGRGKHLKYVSHILQPAPAEKCQKMATAETWKNTQKKKQNLQTISLLLSPMMISTEVKCAVIVPKKLLLINNKHYQNGTC